MAKVTAHNRDIRRNFGKLTPCLQMPHLLKIQRESYKRILQEDVSPDKREDIGLQRAFNSMFPIVNHAGNIELQFIQYELKPSVFSADECRRRGKTYAATIHVDLRMVVYPKKTGKAGKKSESDGAPTIEKAPKEQSIYFGALPLMTERGTFIINGTERVIVSQLHRSPGVFFEHDKGKSHSSGKILYSARIIPHRGSWLDFEFDAYDKLHVRIDRRRKVHISVLLHALGLSDTEILEAFFETEEFRCGANNQYKMNLYPGDLRPDRLKGMTFKDFDIAYKNKVIVPKGTRITMSHIEELKSLRVRWIDVPRECVLGRALMRDIVNQDGEAVAVANDLLTDELLTQLEEMGVEKIETLFIDEISHGPYISATLRDDGVKGTHAAQVEIYKIMRPGEPPPTPDSAEQLFFSLFQNPERYDLSECGRMKFNRAVERDSDKGEPTLNKDDILAVIRKLVDLRNGKGVVDDIDHLGNRRVRSVGEAIENAFQIGLSRINRAVTERLSQADADSSYPRDLITPKPITSAIRDFFVGSQMSQFMDQINPLSEITHKRRISALGPGGLVRERAGFEVRDVHPTHYGRICPIETPEGQNIGLISSLAIYAKTNEYGFLETPYREVKNSRVTSKIDYLSAIEERKHVIAQANAALDESGKLIDELVSCRSHGEVSLLPPSQVQYMDVSPHQTVSVAAALVPFLEHNDANRALMGANMQRQAVPTMITDRPLVGTGLERGVAKDSGAVVVALRPGKVEIVDASRIVVRVDKPGAEEAGIDIYPLIKYQRSNQDTCVNQRPLVKVGDVVNKGDTLADGHSTDHGELALGQNVLVALMPWEGYNFEDSILISERLVQEGSFTSIHIKELTCVARDTKLGDEEITADIPNISDNLRTKLDESGVIYIGAEVKAGDILVGKVSPKSEGQLSPEERLWRAIFKEKAADVKDASLYAPSGVEGTVIDVQFFTSSKIDDKEKDKRAREIEQLELVNIKKNMKDRLKIYENDIYRRIEELLVGEIAESGPNGLKKGTRITSEYLHSMERKLWRQIRMRKESITGQHEKFNERLKECAEQYQRDVEEQEKNLRMGDDLQPGELKKVKVYIAVKRRIQPGDKLAGRHGNKGVISMIAPTEDMPYMSDGTPIDIVLNPLGVPSRMNVGQVLEAHLGWGAHSLGKQIEQMLEQYHTDGGKSKNKLKDIRRFIDKIYQDSDKEGEIKKQSDTKVLEMAGQLSSGVHMATPVFDGASEEEIKNVLKLAGLPLSGKTTLYDGRTGETFDNEVTVGYMYMLKLNHLADDKMHARSTGPYSMITQQPLGGKAKFGGQRFGEMEVWALEAYGAAYALQEILTVKSDDVEGRSDVYRSIVNDEFDIHPNLPESFNVLIKEVRSLGINIIRERDNA